MRRLRILQIFNRYIHYGGEEGSVFRIGDALQDDHDVEYFFGSTNEFLGNSMARRLTGPMRAFYDPQVSRKLRRYQQVGRFDLWQIHNVFPGLSRRRLCSCYTSILKVSFLPYALARILILWLD